MSRKMVKELKGFAIGLLIAFTMMTAIVMTPVILLEATNVFSDWIHGREISSLAEKKCRSMEDLRRSDPNLKIGKYERKVCFGGDIVLFE